MKHLRILTLLTIASLVMSCSNDERYDTFSGTYKYVIQGEDIKTLMMDTARFDDEELDSIATNFAIDQSFAREDLTLVFEENEVALSGNSDGVMLDTTYVFINENTIQYFNDQGKEVNGVFTDSTFSVIMANPANRNLLFNKVVE